MRTYGFPLKANVGAAPKADLGVFWKEDLQAPARSATSRPHGAGARFCEKKT